MAIISGATWWAINWIIPFFSFNILLAYAAGYAISEVISRVVNRKRSTILAVIASVALVISYSITLILGGVFPSDLLSIAFHVFALALGIYVAVTRLR
jgi:uncharacterized membrane protein YoaK (UPF0700 family)